MAVDMYLKLEGIEGDSVGTGHENEIDVLSWSVGAKQTGSTQIATGGGTGIVEVRDMVIQKRTDKATPTLFQLCCNGTEILKATLTVRKVGGEEPLPYLKLEMGEIIISGFDSGAEGITSDIILETIKLNFAKLRVTYTPQVKGGAGGAELFKGWNIATKTKWDTGD